MRIADGLSYTKTNKQVVGGPADQYAPGTDAVVLVPGSPTLRLIAKIDKDVSGPIVVLFESSLQRPTVTIFEFAHGVE